jgi:VCBS repeat-containing protein
MIKASCSISLSSKEKQLRKINNYSIVILTSLILIGIIFLNEGWFTPNSEGFAIYLTKEDISPAQLPVLSHVEIAEKPIIAKDDIISYNAYTHKITLTTDAFNQISELDVPVTGKSFLVCVDKNLIYHGAFWSPISSLSFDGVTIWKPLNSESMVIKLELGYPSPFFYGGDDPRNNIEIMKSLKEDGKLANYLSYETVDKLPHSMKGYELYSWQENGQWHFTLITGTNRLKRHEEIISTINIVSQDGWVTIHVEGVDEISSVLGRLPRSEDILWISKLRIEQSQQDIVITLPKETTMNTIKEYSMQRGLNLQIQPSS